MASTHDLADLAKLVCAVAAIATKSRDIDTACELLELAHRLLTKAGVPEVNQPQTIQ
jgi:hypothetical protein